MKVVILILGLILYTVYGFLTEKIEAELQKIDARLHWYIYFDKDFAYAFALEDEGCCKK